MTREFEGNNGLPGTIYHDGVWLEGPGGSSVRKISFPSLEITESISLGNQYYHSAEVFELNSGDRVLFLYVITNAFLARTSSLGEQKYIKNYPFGHSTVRVADPEWQIAIDDEKLINLKTGEIVTDEYYPVPQPLTSAAFAHISSNLFLLRANFNQDNIGLLKLEFVPKNLSLTIEQAGGVRIDFSGNLSFSSKVDGPYRYLGNESPYRADHTSPMLFFKIR
jgi:hypothetical protein